MISVQVRATVFAQCFQDEAVKKRFNRFRKEELNVIRLILKKKTSLVQLKNNKMIKGKKKKERSEIGSCKKNLAFKRLLHALIATLSLCGIMEPWLWSQWHCNECMLFHWPITYWTLLTYFVLIWTFFVPGCTSRDQFSTTSDLFKYTLILY